MSETTTSKPAASRTTGNEATDVATASASLLVTEHGKTTISDAVVAKIAGIASREVSGVHALGGSTARAVGALRERIPGGRVNHSQGVSVEVGEREAAVDLELVAEYGVSITDLSAGIRRNVILAIERMTGLAVTEVNILIQDVYLPTDDEDGNDTSDDSGDARRVQ